VKSAAVKPKYDIVNIPDNPIDFLEVEGKGFNLAYSQLVINCLSIQIGITIEIEARIILLYPAAFKFYKELE
jgi:hypothetical protein